MKKITILVIGLSLFWASPSKAGSYGPKEKRLGAGIVLGDPTGFSAKGFIAPKLGVDVIVSWSFVDGFFQLLCQIVI